MFHLAVRGNWWLRVMAEPTVSQRSAKFPSGILSTALSAEILNIQKLDPVLILSWFSSNQNSRQNSLIFFFPLFNFRQEVIWQQKKRSWDWLGGGHLKRILQQKMLFRSYTLMLKGVY